ncbi:MAG TPA: thrombospondin type 3 repeat-containing protein, partial [Aggregatilineales bacterium]|nr:thrombospondin type 3 repeat-containing protein [Aggregatilineales bacterium]
MMSQGPAKQKGQWFKRLRDSGKAVGQSAVEYALILTLIVMGIAVVISVSGPAIGNVFSNTVANLLNLTTTPEDPLSEQEFWNLVTAVASFTPDTVALITNTPVPGGNNDSDNDGIKNDDDNCPNNSNTDQADDNSNGIGNVCDPTSGDYNVDDDNDGVLDNTDNCPGVANPDQADADSD